MEATEYRLTRETCFVGRRPEVVAVAGLLWISWWVWGEWGGISVFSLFLPSNAHGLFQVWDRLASIYEYQGCYSIISIDLRPGFRRNLFSSNIWTLFFSSCETKFGRVVLHCNTNKQPGGRFYFFFFRPWRANKFFFGFFADFHTNWRSEQKNIKGDYY